ncbi:MAG: hypothetical protein RL205_685 [Actinomycetota bacterium]|jgi:hypothetical protein
MKTSTRIAAAACTSALVLGLGITATGTAFAADASPSPSASALIGGSPGTWTPIFVKRTDSGTTISVVKDQAVVFKGFNDKAHFTSSNKSVFVVSDAEGTGTVTASAGGHAVKAGKATVTVTRGGKTVATYSVIVKK